MISAPPPHILVTPFSLWASYLPPKRLEGRRGSRGSQMWSRNRWSAEPCQRWEAAEGPWAGVPSSYKRSGLTSWRLGLL